MLLPRVLTALVGVPLLLFALWVGGFAWMVLIWGILLLSLYEFYSLMVEARWPVAPKLGLGIAGFLSIALFLVGTDVLNVETEVFSKNHLLAVVLTIGLLSLLVAPLFSRKKENSFIQIALTFWGLFYVALPLGHLVLIRALRPNGREWTTLLFLMIWAVDSGAYFGGKRWGKHALAASISPKKTWEGAIIGLLLALAIVVLAARAFLPQIAILPLTILAVLTIVAAQVSDLTESLFKRNVGVKDSGALLPGHGGFLDRFDSFLLAAPVFYYGLFLLGLG